MKKVFSKIILFQLLLVMGLFVMIAIPQPVAAVNCVTEQQCKDLGESNNTKIKFSVGGGCTEPKGVCTADLADIKLNVPIGGFSSVDSIETYIERLFQFLVGAAGVVAVTMLVLGGYTYITAAGNQARVGRAKDFIVNALVGLVMVFGSVVFLGTLNDRLVQSGPFRVELINPRDIVEGKYCTQPADDAICGQMTSEATGGALCRSGVCSSGICLPVSIGGINNVTSYKCYENNLDGLITACENAPSDKCDVINRIKIGNNEYGLEIDATAVDGCSSYSSECFYAEALTCPSGTATEGWIPMNCTQGCGGKEIPDDEDFLVQSDTYYCSDPILDNNYPSGYKPVYGWRDSGLMGDNWGAMCCVKLNINNPNPTIQERQVVSANGNCEVKEEDGKPKKYCDD